MRDGGRTRLVWLAARAGAGALGLLLLAHGRVVAEDKPADPPAPEVAKAVDAYLEKMVPTYREQLESMVNARSGEIITGLSLPKERADQIRALAKQAADESLKAWVKTARTNLLNFPEGTRNNILKGSTYYPSRNDKDDPENQPVWKDGLARLLTDEDRAHLQTVREDKRARRVQAFARLLVALLDEKLALTAAQRPKLEPVAERVVPGEKQFFPEPDNNRGRSQYYSLSYDLFYKVAAQARPEEVRAVLDDLQQKRWVKLGHEDSSGGNDGRETPAATPQLTAASEPEDVEGVVSDFLRLKTAAARRQLEAVMLLRAEDAVRVAGLAAPHAGRLRTAALGATEAAIAVWEQSLEQTVRSLVQDATYDTVEARLADASRYYFNSPIGEEYPIWTDTAKAELTPDQQTAWQAERDARSRYHDEAVAGFLLAEFERKFASAPEVRERLLPIIAKAIHDYQPDIAQMFSYNNGTPWYLAYYSMFLPMQSLPEAEGKSLLGPECYERWTHSTEYGYSTNYWHNVQQYHENRMKENKP